MVLDADQYGDNQVANRDDCVRTINGEWALEEDMDSDWVYLETDNVWAEKGDCLVIVDADGDAKLHYDEAIPDGYTGHDNLDAATFNSDWDDIECVAHPDYLASLEQPEEGEAA
ncbi:hypothetical protein FQZ97_1171930 [compost metagenome]